MASPRDRLQAALCSSACFVERMTAVVLVAATLEQSLHLAEAAAVTTTWASSKTALDCASGEVDEACTQRDVSISSLCYCFNRQIRYCSDICHGESTNQLCTSNCPDFSKYEGKTGSLPDSTNNLTIALIVVATLLFVGMAIFFSVTFVRYRRRVIKAGGTVSFCGYLKYLRCGSDEEPRWPIEQHNPFPGVAGTVADNNSDSAMTPLRHVLPNESESGATVFDSGLAHN